MQFNSPADKIHEVPNVIHTVAGAVPVVHSSPQNEDLKGKQVHS